MKVFLLFLAVIFSSVNSISAPVAEADRVPVDFRRTTLVVQDMTIALKIYRDTLGLKPYYDQIITLPQPNGSTKKMHLVILRGNDDFIGALGLLQYLDPLAKPKQANERHIGDAILIFNTDQIEQRFAAIKKIPGVQIESEPTLTEYPSPKGPIKVIVSTFYDPNGIYVELNHMLK